MMYSTNTLPFFNPITYEYKHIYTVLVFISCHKMFLKL